MAQIEDDTYTGIQFESDLETIHINITLPSGRVLKDQTLNLKDTVLKLISTICEEHDDVTHQPNEITLVCQNGTANIPRMAEQFEAEELPETIEVQTVYLNEKPTPVEYLIDEKVLEEKVRVCKDQKWDKVPMEQLNMIIKIGTNAPVVMEDTKQLGHYVPKDKAGYTFQFVRSSSSN